MKFLLPLFILLALPIRAYSQVFISASFGSSAPTDELYKSFVGMGELGIRSSILSFSMSAMSLNQKNKVHVLQPGNLNLIPVMFTLKLRLPITKRTKANLGGGIGYVFASHDMDESITRISDYYGYRIRNELADGIEKHFVGGFEHRINKHYSFGVSLTYMLFDTKAKTILQDRRFLIETETISEAKLNLDNLYGLFNFVYSF